MKYVYVTLFSVAGFVVLALIDPNSAVAWYAGGAFSALLGLLAASYFTRPRIPIMKAAGRFYTVRGEQIPNAIAHGQVQLPRDGITAGVPGVSPDFVFGCPFSDRTREPGERICICAPGFGHRAHESAV